MSVTNPQYYGSDQCASIAESLGLHKHAHLFNAWCYVWRAGRKGSLIEDFVKANWYLKRIEANRYFQGCVNDLKFDEVFNLIRSSTEFPFSIVRLLSLIAKVSDGANQNNINLIVQAIAQIDLVIYAASQQPPIPVEPIKPTPAFTYTDGFWDQPLIDKEDPRQPNSVD